ncbi:hypothetical protein JL101_020595 [Skermanella rosea]|uniref:hypothetical protein n=1 Tax=Skermanella rosea TaxID=1817965 RepID=UPI001933FE70|nr:hypothetical protein [Skermanella rosea]UEM02373.1 hypothetical protein JL101_020595 [Skermanella rosea]
MLTLEEMVASGQRITTLFQNHPNPAGERPANAKLLERLDELKGMQSLQSRKLERRVALG